MRLSELIGDRNNNLNLVRITAAMAVLVTHSFALTLGPNAEPLRQHLGTTLGTIAVDVFFVASGFLVTFSLAKRQSVLEFVLARALRILPALFVMLLLSVAVLGPAFTALPLADYFADRRVATYLIKGATLVTGIEFELPGVFLRNPYPAVVNGSLWTLPWEVAMYGLLLLAWIGAKFSSTLPRSFSAFKLLVFAIVVASGVVVVAAHWRGEDKYHSELYFMFFSGAAAYLLRHRIVLSWPSFWTIALALLISALHRQSFFVVYHLAIAYLVLFIAFVPQGAVRHYNRVGDYSYGVYIYAFPVQQAAVAWWPQLTVLEMMGASALATLALAAASWHLVEHRALAAKSRLVARARMLFRRAA